jgi:hypothetical protein
MTENREAYNVLAWTEGWFVNPEDYEEEATHYVSLIKEHCSFSPASMLHLGKGNHGGFPDHGKSSVQRIKYTAG